MSFTCECGEHVEQRAQHRDHSLAGGNLAAVVRRRAMAGVERRHRADRDLGPFAPGSTISMTPVGEETVQVRIAEAVA